MTLGHIVADIRLDIETRTRFGTERFSLTDLEARFRGKYPPAALRAATAEAVDRGLLSRGWHSGMPYFSMPWGAYGRTG